MTSGSPNRARPAACPGSKTGFGNQLIASSRVSHEHQDLQVERGQVAKTGLSWKTICSCRKLIVNVAFRIVLASCPGTESFFSSCSTGCDSVYKEFFTALLCRIQPLMTGCVETVKNRFSFDRSTVSKVSLNRQFTQSLISADTRLMSRS